MPNTLFGRLLLSSLLLLSLFFGFLGFIINQVFQQNILDSKQEQLRLQNYVLLSSAQFGETEGIVLPDELREVRFDQYESGLYGYITDYTGKILWTSYSSHNLSLDSRLLAATNPAAGAAQFIETEKYYIFHYTVLWEIIEDQPQLITFSVLEDTAATKIILSSFRHRLQLWLAGIGVTLIVILMLVLRWGTSPLRQLATKLKQVENGKAARLEGDYPWELRGITNNLNELLATEQRQRQRYHATLSDLAHSLKTPLAVIQAELASDRIDKPLIAEQTQRMDDIIKHQLQRAVVTSPHKLGNVVDVQSCVDRLFSALTKVYSDKGINFESSIDPGIQFRGDQRDLIEVLGNLIDNACKACRGSVKLEASCNREQLTIDIHDDGDGIPIEQHEQLIKRGLRADSRYSGQGIGLAVSHDIIESYHGKIVINDSPLGGALFRIILPAH